MPAAASPADNSGYGTSTCPLSVSTVSAAPRQEAVIEPAAVVVFRWRAIIVTDTTPRLRAVATAGALTGIATRLFDSLPVSITRLRCL